MANGLSDITVKLNIEQPSVPVNMGVLAIFNKASKEGEVAGSKEYSDGKEFAADYPETTSTGKVGQGYFNQADHGEKLVVITYADQITSSADEYYDKGWEFATVTGEGAEDDVVTLAQYLDGKGERFAVYAYPAVSGLIDGLDDTAEKYAGIKRAIVLVAGEDGAAASYGVGALVGALGNETVGSITWKFKTLGGVAPVKFLTVSEVKKLHEKKMFTYVTKAGVNQTSEGTTMGGDFIDALHGDDWIKASIESSLQRLLSSSNKLAFDAAGIATIDAAVTDVLTTATNNGIILANPETGAGEFNVTTVSRADTPAADIALRQYNGLAFSYTRAGAIHSVTVSGEISI